MSSGSAKIERRRWIWGKLISLSTAAGDFEVPAGEILPADFAERLWLLAEIRGYRGNSTAITNPALVSRITPEGCDPVLVAGATGDGLGVDPQSGPIPLWIPMPRGWNGKLIVSARSDSGASQSFRFHFSFVEVTEAEWASCVGARE